MVKGLADVMQQTGTAGQLNIDTQLTGHQTGQPGHLERVAQDVLAEARAVLQAANELDKVGMQAVNAKLHDGLIAFALHLDFQLAAALVHGLLDAGRMDTPSAIRRSSAMRATSRRVWSKLDSVMAPACRR